MKHLFALAALLFCIGGGQARAGDYQTLIENGNNAGEALASTVALLTYGGGGGFCSASFLSSRTLITAGHCASGSITVNVPNPKGGYYRAHAASVQAHPQYANYKDRYGMTIIRNDLAIIQLAQPFPAPVRPVALAAFPASQWAPVTDVGYGFYRGHTGGMLLRWGRMQARLQQIGQFDDRTGLEQRNSYNQNVCPGDSGGAVLYGDPSSRSLVAVHSLANGCGTGPSTGASSELVWPARAWIQAQIR